jgi:transposase
MGQVLAAFAADVGAGPTKRIVPALDNADRHTSPRLAIPEGLHLVTLPPYTPELQPDERVWPLLNERLTNRDHADLPALEDAIAARCRDLLAQSARIRGATRYHGWPDA